MREPKYAPYIDGQWLTMKQGFYDLACCDCGLVHRFEFRVRAGKVQWRAFRDNRQTANHRRSQQFRK